MTRTGWRWFRAAAAGLLVVGSAAVVTASSGLPASMASLAVRSGALSFTTASVSVPRSTPTLSQSSTATRTAGVGTVTDVVTVSAGTAAGTGSLTVRLWADAACTVAVGTPVTLTVAGADGVSYSAAVPTPTAAGTYFWTAAYSGDADDDPAASVCGAPGSTVVVTPGPAAALTFTTQPGGGRVGVAWAQQPVVAVRDAFGNAVATATLVSLAVTTGSGSGAGTLTCSTNPVTSVAGSATFAGCSINAAGTGYTLVASSSGLPSVTSSAFDVVAGVRFVATGPVTTTTANTNVSVAYPTGTASGDLVLLVVVTANSAATTAPTGWTALADQTAASGSDRLRLMVWWRPAAGESSVLVGLKGNPSGGSAWVVRYARPAGSGPAITAATSTVQQGTGAATASLTPAPDLTTSLPGATVISIVAVRQANPLGLATAAGFTTRTATTSTPTGGAGVALAFADRSVDAAAAAVASPTWSQSGTPGAWAWATVAFA